VPDLISAFRNIDNALRQLVMRVGENKNFHITWIGRSGGDAKIVASPPRLISSSPRDESVRPADKGLLDPPDCAILQRK
jgi:hypothetical protein